MRPALARPALALGLTALFGIGFVLGRGSRARPAEPASAPRAAKLAAYRPDLAAVGPGPPVRLVDSELEPQGSSRLERVAVSLDGQRRNAIGGGVPFAFRARLRVPEQAELWLAIDHEGAGVETSGVGFLIHAHAASARRLVFERRRAPWETGWSEARVDLGAWAGQEVELEFEATPASSGPPRAAVRAFWADVFVCSRGTAARPNLVILLLDTLRPDHLGAYGYSRPTSPQIDAIATEGVLFRNAYSSAPWTDPAILSLFTGLYPSDLWEPAPHREAIVKKLPEAAETLAERLARAGYFTIAASDHPGVNARRFGQGFDVFAELYHAEGAYAWRQTQPLKVAGQLASLLADRGGGVFAYLHLIYPHVPYRAPDEYRRLLGLPEPEAKGSGGRSSIDRYDMEVRQADDVVGFVRRWLEERGLARHTVLLVLSDHGEGFGEHGLFEHGNSLYGELLRIPMILWAPGRLPGGLVVNAPARIVDVTPTLLDLLGIAEPQGLRGASLLPLIEGREPGERVAYAEFPHSRMVRGYSIQSSDLKLIIPGGDEASLERFALAQDPVERTPLAAGQHGEAALLAAARGIRASAVRRRGRPEAAVEEPSVIERLRALGYVR